MPTLMWQATLFTASMRPGQGHRYRNPAFWKPVFGRHNANVPCSGSMYRCLCTLYRGSVRLSAPGATCTSAKWLWFLTCFCVLYDVLRSIFFSFFLVLCHCGACFCVFMDGSQVNFLALDFDLTILDIHTSGRWPGTPEQLAQRIRPFFQALIPAAVAAGK